MASLVKFSGSRGDRAPDITVGAGADLAGTDAFEVNFDITLLTARDAVEALDQVKRKILEGAWPPL